MLVAAAAHQLCSPVSLLLLLLLLLLPPPLPLLLLLLLVAATLSAVATFRKAHNSSIACGCTTWCDSGARLRHCSA
jgi:hypothetical protein